MSERTAGKNLVQQSRNEVIQAHDAALSPADISTAIAALVGGLAKSNFDQVNVSLSSETTAAGSRTQFDFRGWRKDGAK